MPTSSRFISAPAWSLPLTSVLPVAGMASMRLALASATRTRYQPQPLPASSSTDSTAATDRATPAARDLPGASLGSRRGSRPGGRGCQLTMVKLSGRRRGSNDRRAGSQVAARSEDVVRTGDTGVQTLQCRTVRADAVRMRLPILVYGVLYVVLEMVGHALESVGWGRVTPLHVASALVDALLLIVMAIAVLVLWDVARRRWGP